MWYNIKEKGKTEFAFVNFLDSHTDLVILMLLLFSSMFTVQFTVQKGRKCLIYRASLDSL